MIHIFSFILFLLHPFYVSVTDINYNSKSKMIEISSKIFCDDLENVIFKENKLKIDIINPKDKNLANILVAGYIKKHLQLRVNGQNLTLKFIGYEISDAAVWCYLETDRVNKINIFEIKNDILISLHAEQNNLINLKISQKEENLKLDESHTNYKILL